MFSYGTTSILCVIAAPDLSVLQSTHNPICLSYNPMSINADEDVHLTLLNSVALIMCSFIRMRSINIMLCVPRYVWFNSVFSNNKGMSCGVCISLDARQ